MSTFSNSRWLSESQTELTSCGPNVDHQVEQLTVPCYSLFHPLPRKRVTISWQLFDLYNRIRCRGNVFLLAIVMETSVYLVVAHQRTSGSGSTIPAFRRHVTILSAP
jgi:hypothetical protein